MSPLGAPVCEHGYQLSARSIEIGIPVHMATGKLCGASEQPVAATSEALMTAAPAWMGVTSDHLIETCPHRARSRPELERHGWWQQCHTEVNPGGDGLCGWCVRVWQARNRKATT